jgi:hypothetical protein
VTLVTREVKTANVSRSTGIPKVRTVPLAKGSKINATSMASTQSAQVTERYPETNVRLV